jgi:hypothetical protein
LENSYSKYSVLSLLGRNFAFEDVPAFAEDVSGVLKKYLRDLPDPLLSDGTAEDALQGKFGAALRT